MPGIKKVWYKLKCSHGIAILILDMQHQMLYTVRLLKWNPNPGVIFQFWSFSIEVHLDSYSSSLYWFSCGNCKQKYWNLTLKNSFWKVLGWSLISWKLSGSKGFFYPLLKKHVALDRTSWSIKSVWNRLLWNAWLERSFKSRV